jgi:hypothetical protein
MCRAAGSKGDALTVREYGPTYRSYLLRLWQTGDEGEIAWRAALEDVQTGERLGFPSLDALVAYLREVTAGEGEETDDK